MSSAAFCRSHLHWTGGEKRLNRDTLMKSKGMNSDDENYPREELVAELGSMKHDAWRRDRHPARPLRSMQLMSKAGLRL
jgi:antirestriction protein ArdC